MQLHFGLYLDDLTLPPEEGPVGGSVTAGPRRLLSILETHLGLAGLPDNIDYLRIEQFRQALLQLLKDAPAGELFFEKSFHADPFATAAGLLSLRDELLLAGWDFHCMEDTPPRLRTLAGVEAIFHAAPVAGKEQPLALSPGFADRFVRVLERIPGQGHPFTKVQLNEPMELLPPHFQRLFLLINKTGACPSIEPPSQPPPRKKAALSAATQPDLFSVVTTTNEPTDLEKFQQHLSGQTTEKQLLSGDGSLLLLKARRSNEAADFVAQWLRLNPSFRPACLIPEKNRTLDVALIKEGLPGLGILSASLARPALQILKLAPAFLWQPIDPYKILEFVSLAIKPLPDELATEIARQVARSPGLHGEGWHSMISRYFTALEEREPPAVVKTQKQQYQFWFERTRYRSDRNVPKRDVVQVYGYLHQWARKAFEENGSKNHSLIVLSEQAKRVVELLQALPENELDYLQLERIVRTIYEPSPVTFHEREVGHLPFAMHPGAFTNQVEEVMWWDFVQNEPPHFFSHWYARERSWLQQRGLHPDTPEQENARLLWHRNRPVLMAEKRLVLVIPEIVDGNKTLAHPLLGNLEAAFDDLEKITAPISQKQPAPILSDHFRLPAWLPAQRQTRGKPQPFLRVQGLAQPGREYETLTSLDALFYYPYQWFFKYKIKLTQSAILSVVKDRTLMGNLAHRVFEKMLKMPHSLLMKQADVYDWVASESERLFTREGAVLLMYGREPERIAFVNKLKYAAWSLLTHLRENHWEVVDTEKELSGLFPFTPPPAGGHPPVEVRGVADLVLRRDKELAVVDLKWSGAAHRTNVLKNEEDLQLVLYARLLADNGPWPHTAYFIIENGKMIARNNLAFKGSIAPAVSTTDFAQINERILKRMEATFQWRMSQLAKGEIEIRTRQTAQKLEEIYNEDGQGNVLFEILEMKGEDARWDDYHTLINLEE